MLSELVVLTVERAAGTSPTARTAPASKKFRFPMAKTRKAEKTEVILDRDDTPEIGTRLTAQLNVGYDSKCTD